MRYTLIMLTIFTIFGSTASATAQTRRHRTTRSSSSSKSTAAKSAQLKAGRDELATQIKTVSRFLYLYSPIARDIQSAQNSSADSASSPAAVKNAQSRNRLVGSLRDIRDGLVKMQTDLSSNSEMKDCYPFVVDVGDLAEQAERLAAANRFDEAGRTLLKVLDRLTDALAATR